MSRPEVDPELAEYRNRIGAETYSRQYTALYNMTRHAKRYSGQKYTNSSDRLQALKEKYKHGVSRKEINKMLGIKEDN